MVTKTSPSVDETSTAKDEALKALGLDEAQMTAVMALASMTASTTVSTVLARRRKSDAMKNYGIQAAISAAVFAVGTATMIGVDKYRHRNDQRSKNMNPQYTGSQV